MEHVTATLEWHYYCPKCERACLTRFSGSDESWRTICSDCGTKYEVCPTKRALDFAICAPEYHASLDEAGDRFCRMCGQPLSQ